MFVSASVRQAKLLTLALKLSKHFNLLSTLLSQEAIIHYKKLYSIRKNETLLKRISNVIGICVKALKNIRK
jgi:hypothetical protein